MLAALSRWLAYLTRQPRERGAPRTTEYRIDRGPRPAAQHGQGASSFYTGIQDPARPPTLPDGQPVDTAVIPFITGGGGAIVVLAFLAWAFFAGRLHSDREFNKLERENDALRAENDQLREAIRTERKTSDEIASTAVTTNKLIEALTEIASERRPPGSGSTREVLGS